MNAKTLKALKGSIRKWQRIVAGTGRDEGPNNCPLCKLFWHAHCQRCPVFKVTELENCGGTPYESWEGWKRVKTKEQRHIAQRELDFLKSLLP